MTDVVLICLMLINFSRPGEAASFGGAVVLRGRVRFELKQRLLYCYAPSTI